MFTNELKRDFINDSRYMLSALGLHSYKRDSIYKDKLT